MSLCGEMYVAWVTNHRTDKQEKIKNGKGNIIHGFCKLLTDELSSI